MTRFNDAGRSGEDSRAEVHADSSAGLFLRSRALSASRIFTDKGSDQQQGQVAAKLI